MFGLNSKKSAAGGQLSGDLRDQQRRFEVIINSLEYGVVLLDDQQTIRLINPAAAALCEWPLDEAAGINIKNVLQLVNDKGQPFGDAENPLLRVFRSAQPLRENNAFLQTRTKKQVAISLSLSPLLGDDKRIVAATAVFHDVSQERGQEQQRADFISTASHEMRTPVAAIEGYLALALNDKVATIDARARGYLEKAHSSTLALGKLFLDLLNSAKAEDGRLTSHPVAIELGTFLEQLTNDLRFAADKKGLGMEFVVGSSQTINAVRSVAGEHVIKPLYYVYADPDRLREVITNLFDNAVKYTQEGKISIGLTGDNQVVQCYVRDTGSGIPAEDVPHLFQKFYRVDNSSTRTVGGTGLGLFIARKIIELYNGRVWVESEVGKGSSFYINLPRLTTEKALQLQATNDGQLKPISSLSAT